MAHKGYQPSVISPIKIQVGKANYRKADGSSAAALSRSLGEQLKNIQDDLSWYINQVEGALPNVVARSLEPTLELAQSLCPVSPDGTNGNEPGYLRDSAYIAVESFRNGTRVEIGFAAGGDPDYAIYVHEMPYRHEPPTQNKFLQAALDQDWANFATRLSQNARTMAGTGG